MKLVLVSQLHNLVKKKKITSKKWFFFSKIGRVFFMIIKSLQHDFAATNIVYSLCQHYYIDIDLLHITVLVTNTACFFSCQFYYIKITEKKVSLERKNFQSYLSDGSFTLPGTSRCLLQETQTRFTSFGFYQFPAIPYVPTGGAETLHLLAIHCL